MSIGIRPISVNDQNGDQCKPAGSETETVPTSPASTPVLYKLIDNGIIWSGSPKPCWKCGGRYMESEIVFTFIDHRGVRYDRIVAWNILDSREFLSSAFKRQIDRDLAVRPNYSKRMGNYLTVNCPRCGAIQGVNYIIHNYQNGGGVFSNPMFNSVKLQVRRLPLLAVDHMPREYQWAFGDYTCSIQMNRLLDDGLFVFDPMPTPLNPSPWNPWAER